MTVQECYQGFKQFVGSDIVSKCLQMLLADNKKVSHYKF